jgi:hypothetical protein
MPWQTKQRPCTSSSAQGQVRGPRRVRQSRQARQGQREAQQGARGAHRSGLDVGRAFLLQPAPGAPRHEGVKFGLLQELVAPQAAVAAA